METKKLIVPKYIFRDKLGTFKFNNIEILVDSHSGNTAETFDQDIDDYSISSHQIEFMARESLLIKMYT